MRILLDTHIFMWWDANVQRLSAGARALCEDPNNSLVLSLASVWEMQIKEQLGKLTMRLPLATLIAQQQSVNGLEILPIQLDHILALSNLPHHHKDPFDRLLIAQSNLEQIPLLTADAIFSMYSVQLLP